MFEQQSYNNEYTQAESSKGDLFNNYEIRNWNFSSAIYTIIAVSVLLNLGALAFIGQTNLLTRRGCDSPFVGRVCQVLDMAYVGTVLFGTEREYVDMAYEKTDLGDADITYIDVSGETPPLSYPAGYFQIANPVQYAMLQQQLTNPVITTSSNIPGFPMSTPMSDSDILKLMPSTPKANPNAFMDDSTTTPPFSAVNGRSRSGGIKRGRGGRVKPIDDFPDTKVLDEQIAAATPSPTPKADPTPVSGDLEEARADRNGVYINKRPLGDYAKTALEKIDSKAVKLDSPVKVVISGTLALGKDGKTIILKNPKPVRSKSDPVNDPAMEKFVQNAILAVGDTGWFGYLDRLQTKNVVITVEQNDTNFVASVRADQPSENHAKQAASGLNATITLGKALAKGDELVFLDLAKTISEGKTFILNFDIPKPLVQELILRKLAESKEKENKPNSTALVLPNNKNTAEK